jgi:hypothetical protein
MLNTFNLWLSEFRDDWEGCKEEIWYREFFQRGKVSATKELAYGYVKLWAQEYQFRRLIRDDDAFLKRYLDHFSDDKEAFLNWITKDWEKAYSAKKRQKSAIERCHNMIGVLGYELPKQPSGVMHDLAVCFFFFSHPEYDTLPLPMKEGVTSTLVRLSLVLTKSSTKFINWKKREYARTSKSSEAQKRRLTDRKQMVFGTYYSTASIRSDTKPYTAARIIHESLKGKGQDPPSIKTILRYLREEAIIK